MRKLSRVGFTRLLFVPISAVVLLQPFGQAATPTARPQGAADNSALLLRQFNTQAQQAYAAGQFDVAEARYREALKYAKQPELQIVLWSNLGAVCREQRHYEPAEEAFKQAMAVATKNKLLGSPAAVTVMRQYAVLLRKLHRAEEADALEGRAVASAAISSGVRMPAAGLPSSRAPVAVQPPKQLVDKQELSSAIDYKKMSAKDASRLASEHPDNAAYWMILAQKYIDEKDWTNAAQAVETVMRRVPAQTKKARVSLAYCHYKAGDYQSAINEMKTAVEENPNNGDYVLSLYDYTLASGDSKAALEIEKSFVEKFPGHPQHEKVAQHFEYAENDAKYQSERDNFKNKPLPPERRQSFPLNMMPLKVYIHNRYDSTTKFEPHSQVSEDTPAELIQKSCDAWSAGSGNRVQFLLTDRIEDSNIEVFLTEDSDGLEEGYAQGITEHAQRGESKKRIRLLTIHRETNKPLNCAEFFDVCLHEFGHALGLKHSGNVSDIMFQNIHDKPLCGLSHDDTERITLLYTSGSN